MSKPLFFTRRKNIARSDVTIYLIEGASQTSRFTASLNLSSYKLPGDGKVTIEAYHNAYLERFDAPQVAALAEDVSFELHGLEPGDRPLFRIKVVDGSTGKLLAAIDEVRPESDDVSEASGSLLPIIPKSRSDMGDEFWRLNFTQNTELSPELWVNRDASGILTAFQMQDVRVIGLLMPEILRQILTRLVGNGEAWAEDGVVGAWLEFSKELAGERFEEWDDDDDEAATLRLQWIGSVVAQFALKQRFLDRYLQQRNAEDSEDSDA